MDNLSFQNLVNDQVKKLTPYLPGRSIAEIQKEYHIQDVIKLASNENPLGCSPKVMENIHSTFKEDISIYPATSHHPLMENLCQFLNISPGNLIIGNGSDALFSLLIQAYALPFHKKILTHEYAFMGYEIQATGFGIETLKAKIYPQTWQVNINELIELSQKNIALIFIANPNNPTGQKIEWPNIYHLLDNIPPETLCILDEAYFEYDDTLHPNINQLIKTYPNLVITRTFSKGYGLAALRIGYAIAHAQVIETLKRIQLPFSINQLGLNAANNALGDQTFIEKTKKINDVGMNFLQQEIEKIPLTVRISWANFITIEYHKNIRPLVQYLESQGIIIRGLHAFGLSHVARITVGTQEQNQRLITTLQQFKEFNQ